MAAWCVFSTDLPVLVACLEPVDIAPLQDDIFASFDETQVMWLGAGEVIEGNHYFLFIFLLFTVLRIRRKRKSLPLDEEAGVKRNDAFDSGGCILS